MLRLLAALGLSLPLVPTAAQQAPPARYALAPLFVRARADPAGVVPLILEASAALPSLDPSEARLLADSLEPFCRRAFFGAERLPGMERLGLAVHKVSAGEVPERIA